MAASGSFSTSSYAGRRLDFAWAIQSQNVDTNKTTITWTLKGAGSASAAWYMAGNFKVKIDGVVVYSSEARIQLYNGTTVASGTYTFTHNADGTRSFTASAEAGIYTYAVNCTGSGSWALTTIPRATAPTLSASSVDMGTAVTISLARASSNFVHDLAYQFQGGAWVSIATGVATSYAWTVPDLASLIPNATSGTLTVRAVTRNGSTTIGTKTASLTARVPASVVPVVSSVTAVEATPGLAAQFGALIQGKSKVTVTVSAAGAKGSTVTSYKTTLQGASYTGQTWTSPILATAGTLTLTATVTDSRGRTGSKSTTIQVVAYAKPSIESLRVYRCDAEGTAQDDGTAFKAVLAYTVPRLNGGNTAAARLEYKRSTAEEYDPTPLWTGSILAVSGSRLITSPAFSSDYTYDVRLTVTDWFGASDSFTAQLPSGAVIMDIAADGKGVAFGKTSERPGVDFGWPVRTSGGLQVIPLVDGVNLNTVATPNVYAGREEAGYVNAPTESTFTLEVVASGDGGQVIQRLTAGDPLREWLRRYNGATWTAWACTAYETGWQTADLGGDFSLYTAGRPVLYRRSGSLVEVRGVVKPAYTFDAPIVDGNVKTITTLPAGFRPVVQDVFTICRGSDTSLWFLRVTTAGAVQFSRYQNGSQYVTAGTNVWLPFSATWLAE